MRILGWVAVAALWSGCTAGAVAVQGNGFLIPAANYDVSYWRSCTSHAKTKTAPDGTFALYNPANTSKYIAPGMTCVLVRSPAGVSTYYYFDHQFDTTCPDGNGDPVACSKDLLMLTGSYDELSANAPGPDVHVRFPASTEHAAICGVFIIGCN